MTSATTSTTEPANETTVAPPTCGDGFVDTDEECDDGNPVQDDACSNTCIAAKCGDGITQTGEECDDSNEDNLDTCRDNCTLIIHRIIFRTSSKYTANLGGLPGASIKCQDAAISAGLANGAQFLPWLGSEVEGPTEIFDLTFDGIYELPDGTPVSTDGWFGLTDSMLDHAIDQDEKGMTLAYGDVWTGANSSGASLKGFTCSSWTTSDSMQQGVFGLTKEIDTTWTDLGPQSCKYAASIYCLEQP